VGGLAWSHSVRKLAFGWLRSPEPCHVLDDRSRAHSSLSPSSSPVSLTFIEVLYCTVGICANLLKHLTPLKIYLWYESKGLQVYQAKTGAVQYQYDTNCTVHAMPHPLYPYCHDPAYCAIGALQASIKTQRPSVVLLRTTRADSRVISMPKRDHEVCNDRRQVCILRPGSYSSEKYAPYVLVGMSRLICHSYRLHISVG
jgi:hypothetical protein